MECMFLKLSAWKSNFQKKKKERRRNNSSQTEKFSTVNFTVIYQQLKKEKQPTAVCNNTDEYHREEFGRYKRVKTVWCLYGVQ